MIPINLRDWCGYTPLDEACNGSDAKTVQYHLGSGKDINIRTMDGVTSLMIACEYQKRDTANVSIHRAEINTQDIRGRTVSYVTCK